MAARQTAHFARFIARKSGSVFGCRTFGEIFRASIAPPDDDLQPLPPDSFKQIVKNPNAFFYWNRPPGDAEGEAMISSLPFWILFGARKGGVSGIRHVRWPLEETYPHDRFVYEHPLMRTWAGLRFECAALAPMTSLV
jgi:hypothetical protein